MFFLTSRLLGTYILPRKVKLSLCFFNWALRHEGVLGSGGIAPCTLDLDIISRWVTSFTSRPLYPQGKSRWYPLDRRLSGPQSRSGRSGDTLFLSYYLLLYLCNIFRTVHLFLLLEFCSFCRIIWLQGRSLTILVPAHLTMATVGVSF
jgi:hypothetical protein